VYDIFVEIHDPQTELGMFEARGR